MQTKAIDADAAARLTRKLKQIAVAIRSLSESLCKHAVAVLMQFLSPHYLIFVFSWVAVHGDEPVSSLLRLK